MKCPCCSDELVAMDEKPYETLVEHGFAPNATPTMKVGYGCENEACPASSLQVRWLHDGEGPYGGWEVPDDAWTDGFKTPPDSWHGRYDRKVATDEGGGNR